MTVDPSDNNSWHNESSPQAPPPPSPPHPRPLAPHPQPTATLAPMCPHACLQTRQGLLYGLSCVVDGTFIEPKVAPNTSSSQPSAPMQPLTSMLLMAVHIWHVHTTRLCTVLCCLGTCSGPGHVCSVCVGRWGGRGCASERRSPDP